MHKFTDKIICGDCIELLSSVKEPFIDLVFADPPFNIGYNYDKYKDKLESKNFIAWTRDWMEACVNALKPGGSFYIAIGDDYAAHIRLLGIELGLVPRNWIIWHYTFGQQTKTMFARAHTHILYFVKDKTNFTYNDLAVRVPSDRQLTYNDKRADRRGKMPDDVWNTYSRVCGTFKEREKWHPCQMPESLLTRIISVSSNEGDLVLDPFNGSGTTASASLQLGRKFCGIDISQNYVDNTRTRLRNLKNQIRKKDGSSDIFSARETLEIKRLFIDMALPVKEINASEKLLGLFTQQFEYRMSNDKTYDQKDIAAALLDFSAWDQKAKSKK